MQKLSGQRFIWTVAAGISDNIFLVFSLTKKSQVFLRPDQVIPLIAYFASLN